MNLYKVTATDFTLDAIEEALRLSGEEYAEILEIVQDWRWGGDGE